MERQVEAKKTLLISGPASLRLVNGKMEVLGAPLPLGNIVVVRKGRIIPFRAREQCVVDVILGGGADLREIVEETIPSSWREVAEAIAAPREPGRVMVVGNADCGKTTFCAFLANRALKNQCPIAVIDADIGQADIGAPTTIGLGLVTSSVMDLFTVKPRSLRFVGVTSPVGATDRVIEGVTSLLKEALELNVNFVIINTDGWIQGDYAKEYKVNMVKAVKPTVLVGIQHEEELEPILHASEDVGVRVCRIEASSAAQRREKEERKKLRELGYRKFLRPPTLRLIPVSWVNIEDSPVSFEKLGIALRESGVLVGLLSRERKFLGLGVLTDINYEKGVLKIYTPIKDRVDLIQFSRIKMDKEGRELGIMNTVVRSSPPSV